MFSRRSALVGGQQQPTATSTDALPPELQTVIASAGVMEREGADKNSPRILVQTARGSFWGHDAEQVRVWLAASWPELTEPQRVRAAAMLAARVVEAQREHAAVSAASRPRWSDWHPVRDILGF